MLNFIMTPELSKCHHIFLTDSVNNSWRSQCKRCCAQACKQVENLPVQEQIYSKKHTNGSVKRLQLMYFRVIAKNKSQPTNCTSHFCVCIRHPQKTCNLFCMLSSLMAFLNRLPMNWHAAQKKCPSAVKILLHGLKF